MKIVLINNLYKPYQRGGAEKITEIIYENLKKRGYEVIIITSLPFFLKERKEKNIYYIRSLYYYLNKIPLFLKLFWHLLEFLSFGKYLKIKKILREEKPDLIITHNTIGLGKLSFLAIKKSKKNHLHILHDIQLIHPSGLLILGQEKKIKTIFSKIYHNLNKKIIGSPNLVISPSQWLMEIHTELNFFKHSNKEIIPNPVDLNISKEKEKNDKTFKLLFAGQIEEHKGVEILLKSFQKINQDESLKNKIKLDIAGSGSLTEKYRKLYGQEKNIAFLGWLNKENLNKEIEKSHILIVPSICYENSPTIIYHALSLGVPVIASKIGGIPEILKKESQLFSPGGSEDLYEKIKKAFHDYESFKKEAIVEREKIKSLNSENYIEKIIKPIEL